MCKCHCKSKPKIKDSWTSNGVSVQVLDLGDGFMHVETICKCLGYDFTAHSNPNCPNLKLQIDNNSI